MAALPYMQLYIADYLADTMHLSTEEHGAYLLLMFNYWQTGRAIPKNRLPKIARVSDERWKELEPVIKEFFEEDNDNWVHLRIERDIETVTSSPRGKKLPAGESLKGFNGYVYFITNPISGLIKIGYSKNPWARLSELRRNYGSDLSVVATIKTVDKSEVSIHTALSKYRVEGEWFTESECIKSLISLIVAGEITTVDATNYYASNYGSAPTATTNTDPDIDTDLKENPEREIRARDEISPEEYQPGTFPAPLGKFAVTKSWTPDIDFCRRAALWGINLGQEPGYTAEELQQFRDYWSPEGKVKHQQQWEQTFAQSLRTSRTHASRPISGAKKPALPKISKPGTTIPSGFRG